MFRIASTGLALIAAAFGGALADESRVLLRNGGEIAGEILRKKADRIVIDLGFTVLSIPMDEVQSIIDAADTVIEARRGASADIFRQAPDQVELTVKENIERCGEAVVEVRTPIGLGSGFIIDPAGYVVTNDHVIAGEHKISITMFRGGDRQLEKILFNNVAIVATHPHADLALLRINDPEAPVFPTVPLGDYARIRPGQSVFAIGSPLGLERSVSEGIVSLRNRAIYGRLFVQSTTQINPGNSGGPLFNLRGEVIGVNNMKISGAGVEGLSFSVAISVLKDFLANRDAFAFDPRNPNAGFIYHAPPLPGDDTGEGR